jgi:hypothetical protein
MASGSGQCHEALRLIAALIVTGDPYGRVDDVSVIWFSHSAEAVAPPPASNGLVKVPTLGNVELTIH